MLEAPNPVQSWVERAAERYPDRVAVDAIDGTLTYRGLALAARALADEALAGLGPGDEVAVALPSGAAFAVALHACLLTGAVAVPEDLRLPDERRADRTRGCARTLTEADVAGALAAGVDAPAAVGTAATDAAAIAGAAPAAAPAPPVPLAGVGIDAATPAARVTTSGTTGPGTPVHLSRGALLWNALGSAAALGQPPHERWLSAMPVSHVGGLTVLIRSAIGGTTAVLRPRFDQDEQLALLQAGAATITSMVPTMLARLLDAGLDHPLNLRLVLLGGGPISPTLIERATAAGIRVASTYGLSEACSQVFTDGAPLFCTQVALRGELDDPALASDDPAAADEILVRGPTLATGVAGPGGWLATGDRGARDASGRFHVIGRIAETIVTGGENVAPTEVESHLVAQPGISDAAVLGVQDAEWGERLEARVVLAPGHDLDEALLRAALRDVLPPYAVPKRITAVTALPRTATGKLIRRELH